MSVLRLAAAGLLLMGVAGMAVAGELLLRVGHAPGIADPLGGTAMVEETGRWLAEQRPGLAIRVAPGLPIGAPPGVIDAATAQRLFADPRRLATAGGPGTIDILYAGDLRPRTRGRAWHAAGSPALITMNARSLAQGADTATMLARERRILRHELVHAVGFVPAADHLEYRDGAHCTDPRCLMHGRITLVDLLSTLLPSGFEVLQPIELCPRCRREIAGE
jgi:hypothetical protein